MKLQQRNGYTVEREYELLEKISDKFEPLLEDKKIAIELANSLCEMLWSSFCFKDDSYAVGFTTREACAIVSDMRNKGEDYLDFYWEGEHGVVTGRIKSLMLEIGYYPVSWDSFEFEEDDTPQTAPRFYIDSETREVVWNTNWPNELEYEEYISSKRTDLKRQDLEQ